MIEKLPVGFIIGPTACGKTALSIAVAKALDAEIVSADSMQVYRGMDIGSAKPTVEERESVPHHLLDVVDVDDVGFSVAVFQKLAGDAIADIAARGKTPLVVGGTGLYINALTYPLTFGEIPSDPKLRDALTEENASAPGSLYARLEKADPESAARLHPNDVRRIVRALEVYTLTGRTIGSFGGDFTNAGGKEIPYAPRIVGLTMPRTLLYARIEARVDDMLRRGLPEEVRGLLQKGYSPALPALQGLGYKQLIPYLRGECELDAATAAIKQETRRFAKRQMTWFRRDERIHWLDAAALSREELFAQSMQILTKREAEA